MIATIGVGSAKPVVSITIRWNGGTSPASRLAQSSASDVARSPRMVQQMQPEDSRSVPGSTASTSR